MALENNMPSIIFTGGGTAGHVFPALAVHAHLPSPLADSVTWIGSRRGMERTLVRAHGLAYIPIPTGKLRRYLDLDNILDAGRVVHGIFSAWRHLGRLRPAVVFSKGGFVAVPVVIAARLRRIPVVIHESDVTPGLATRLTAPFARVVCTAYRETVRHFGRSVQRRAVVTGNPIRDGFRPAADDGEAQSLRAALGLDANGPLVFVTGGSLGARRINELVDATLGGLCRVAVVVHQAGRQGLALVRALAERAPPGRYRGAATFGAEFPRLLRCATLVVSRAGAGTVWEIAASGAPAVLVPLPTGASRGDQLDNARRYAASGAAVVCNQDTLTGESLLELVGTLVADEARRERMSRAARGWGRPDAAAVVARIVARLAAGNITGTVGASEPPIAPLARADGGQSEGERRAAIGT